MNTKTLFELSGAIPPKPDWKNSVFLIIDAQKEYETGPLALPDIEKSVKVIAALLAEARRNKSPVIHVVHAGKGLFDPDGPGFQSIEALKPAQGETILRKGLPSSFAKTELEATLERLGKGKRLILTGYMTHMCVSATAMAALDLGFETFVVSDAVATRDLKSADGSTLPAKQINESSLAALRDRITWVIPSHELLASH